MTTPLVSPRPAAIGALMSAAALIGAVVFAPSAALAQEEKDLYAENAWVIDQIGAEAAWETTKGEGVTVAVVDLGIAEEHPFLEDKNILDGKSFMGDDEVDGRVDTDGHGTGVSAAVLYVAPEATILPVRVNSTSADIGFSIGAGSIDFAGIRWAVDNGADVVVIPWGEIQPGEDRAPAEEFLTVVQYAIDKDVVVIAAAGNDPESRDVGNPGSFGGVVAVSGTDKDGQVASFSTTGPDVELAGPADTMLLPKPQVADFGEEKLYFEAAGTSLTAGVVGGVAALVQSAHPDLDASNVIQRLIATADDGGAGRTDALGFGLVDADRAVHATDVEPVEENPLGYPLGEPGASEASSDEESVAAPTEAASEESTPVSDSEAASGSGREVMPVIVIAAAAVLLVAGLAVWLVLRTRSRPKVQPWQ